MTTQPDGPQPPRTLVEYLRSFGPGFVVVLTWLGAGDIVDMGVAGGNYGYSLMWVLILAVVMRYLFVSLIARYQLCNQHGEGVLDGLARFHPWYAPALLVASVVMGHIYGSYMTVGIGESCRNLMGRGEVWQWSLFWSVIALVIVFQPTYRRVELLFKTLLAVLSASFLGTALWVGPSATGIVQGLYRVELPTQTGDFNPLLVAMAMIGAVGGSMMNLVYPYFLDSKGWRGPQFRRVQMFDFLLATGVMIVLNLAVWTLGAELLHPRGMTVEQLDDLPRLLSEVLGEAGRAVFYCGIFAAVFTSIVGHALGLGFLGTHAWLRWKAGTEKIDVPFQEQRLYRWIACWCILSPLVWTLPGMPDFVTLTLVSNSLQVLLLPLIAGGLWYITASERCIGSQFRNRWWENVLMAMLFVLAIVGAWKSVESIVSGS